MNVNHSTAGCYGLEFKITVPCVQESTPEMSTTAASNYRDTTQFSYYNNETNFLFFAILCRVLTSNTTVFIRC